MGDIADMMINGDLDWETGEYIGEGGGFPRRIGHKHQNGVIKYLGYKNPVDANAIIQKYAVYKQWPERKILKICTKISSDFGTFKKWVSENNLRANTK